MTSGTVKRIRATGKAAVSLLRWKERSLVLLSTRVPRLRSSTRTEIHNQVFAAMGLLCWPREGRTSNALSIDQIATDYASKSEHALSHPNCRKMLGPFAYASLPAASGHRTCNRTAEEPKVCSRWIRRLGRRTSAASTQQKCVKAHAKRVARGVLAGHRWDNERPSA